MQFDHNCFAVLTAVNYNLYASQSRSELYASIYGSVMIALHLQLFWPFFFVQVQNQHYLYLLSEIMIMITVKQIPVNLSF